MAQYVLNTSAFQPGQVGGLYHVGLSNGTTAYGYIFQPGPGLKEETNVADKEKLIQYASPNLIDRDLAFYPRVTQGDFSGGGLQTVFLDPTKYFDSDLEVRTPGFLTLRPAWKRVQLTGTTGTYQCVAWNNDVWTCLGTATIYNSAGTGFAAGITAKFVDTDGSALYVGDGAGTIQSFNGSTFTTVFTSAGNFSGMWVINSGTSGRFLYVAAPVAAGGVETLSKFDMSAPSSTPVSVPLGSMTEAIVDICGYQTGIAILTKDVAGGGNSTLWYHDGANLTRIVHVSQYVPSGICNCLGNLYVTAQSQGNYEAPLLLQVQAGTVGVVARFSSPVATVTSAGIGAPVVAGQYVYFALTNPQISYVTTTSYIGVYDTVSGAASHLPNLDANDAPQTTQPRQLAAIGRAAVFPMSTGGNATLQYQTNQNRLPAGSTFQASGTHVFSRLDFGTPDIPKRFRRVSVVHAPLQAGESVQVTAYVDGDQFHVGQTPSIVGTPNTTVGSTTTVLNMGADTVGRTMYPVITIGGNGTTTPDVIRVAVEIGGTWTWTLELDCTSKRRLLNGTNEDPQGANGKDLYFLIRNAYENGTTLTFYLASGLSYSATIESITASCPSYADHQGTAVKADQEWLVHAVLKQVA
jgi:hypothetical protein